MKTKTLIEMLMETHSYEDIKDIVKDLWNDHRDEGFQKKEEIYLVMVSVLINELRNK